MFIPERFDPNSEYFNKPGTTESRGTFSYIPFSIGARACPGVSFAMLEIKTLLAYLLCRVDYEIDASIMKDEHAFFELEANINLPGRITKKFHY
jgi:cytochrome P450